jgi:chaperonin GroEL
MKANSRSIRTFSTVFFDGNTYRQVRKTPLATFAPKYKTVKILFGDESRKAILRGITSLAETSQLTLGPGGRNVAMEYEGGDPKITKDGVTVLKSIEMEKRAEELGARLLKQSAGNTNKFAGDGTTSSALISKEILLRGLTAISVQDAHPVGLKRGIEKGMRVVL